MPRDLNPWTTEITPVEAARTLSGKALAQYHAFNRAGIYQEWRELSERLLAFGRGYLAYGDAGYLYSRLHELASYKRQRVNRHDIGAVISGIRRTIDKGNAFLAENQESK